MNPVRTGQRILSLVEAYRRLDDAPSIPTLEQVGQAPLLARPGVASSSDGSIDAVVNGSDWAWHNDSPKLPFPVVRFCSQLQLRRELAEVVGVIFASNGDIACIADLGHQMAGATAFGQVCPITKRIECVGYQISGNQLVRNIDLAGMLSVLALDVIWHYTHPSFQPVKVSPEPELCDGRSVEWRQAREFYSVVHRRSGTGDGKRLPHERSMALTAHARRAHERVLRSEKWGANKGRVIWVRSAWVGPKEWRAADSRQIYRVCEFNR